MTRGQFPPEASQQLDSAFHAFFLGRHQEAASLFARMERTLAEHPLHAESSTVMRAWSDLSKGMELLTRSELNEALTFFQDAYRGFASSGSDAEAQRAEAFLTVCQAQELAFQGQFQKAGERFERAAELLDRLADVEEHEEDSFRLMWRECRTERHMCAVFEQAGERDFDGAEVSLARAKQAARTPLEMDSKMASVLAYYEAYLLCGEGIVLLERARYLVASFVPARAEALIDSAAKAFGAACTTLRELGPIPAGWTTMRQLYEAFGASCTAEAMASRAVLCLTGGDLSGAISAGRMASDSYESASRAFAQAGLRGAPGARAAARQRDAFASMANELVARDHSLFRSAVVVEYLAGRGASELPARDFDELRRAYHSGAWRLSIICAGGLIEALLIEAIQRRWVLVKRRCALSTGASKRQVLTWSLIDLIERSAKAGLVSAGTKFLSDALREHRNLVHPGKEQRGRYRIDGPTASAALSVLQTVVEDLSRSASVAAGG